MLNTLVDIEILELLIPGWIVHFLPLMVLFDDEENHYLHFQQLFQQLFQHQNFNYCSRAHPYLPNLRE